MEVAALESSVMQMSAIAARSKGWFKFLGVLSIIGGVLTAFSLVGILIAWLPIWMGVLLFQAGSQADSLEVTKDPNHLVTILAKLRTYFVIQGVLALIVVIAAGLAMLIGGGTIFSLLRGMR